MKKLILGLFIALFITSCVKKEKYEVTFIVRDSKYVEKKFVDTLEITLDDCNPIDESQIIDKYYYYDYPQGKISKNDLSNVILMNVTSITSQNLKNITPPVKPKYDEYHF